MRERQEEEEEERGVERRGVFHFARSPYTENESQTDGKEIR